MNICPICGCQLDYEVGPGEICGCCGNEFGLDDYLTKSTILKKFCNKNQKVLYTLAPELIESSDNEFVPTDISWRFLRVQWIKNGCTLKYKEDTSWNIDKTIQQLQKINYNYQSLKSLIKILNEIDDVSPLVQIFTITSLHWHNL